MYLWNSLAMIIYAVIWVPIIVFLWHIISMAYPNLGKWKWGLLSLMIYLPIWKVIPVQLTLVYLCHSDGVQYVDVKDVYALNHQGRWLTNDETGLKSYGADMYTYESANKIVVYKPHFNYLPDEIAHKKEIFGVTRYQESYGQYIFDSAFKVNLEQAMTDKNYLYQPIALNQTYAKRGFPGDLLDYLIQPYLLFNAVSNGSCRKPYQDEPYYLEIKKFLKVNYGDGK